MPRYSSSGLALAANIHSAGSPSGKPLRSSRQNHAAGRSCSAVQAETGRAGSSTTQPTALRPRNFEAPPASFVPAGQLAIPPPSRSKTCRATRAISSEAPESARFDRLPVRPARSDVRQGAVRRMAPKLADIDSFLGAGRFRHRDAWRARPGTDRQLVRPDRRPGCRHGRVVHDRGVGVARRDNWHAHGRVVGRHRAVRPHVGLWGGCGALAVRDDVR